MYAIRSYYAHGTYKGGPEGFTYVKEGNYWLCPQGKKATFRVRRAEKGNWKDYYLTRRSDCKGCPIKKQCIGKSFEKRIGITIYVDQYTRNNQRVRSKFGRAMNRITSYNVCYTKLLRTCFGSNLSSFFRL